MRAIVARQASRLRIAGPGGFVVGVGAGRSTAGADFGSLEVAPRSAEAAKGIQRLQKMLDKVNMLKTLATHPCAELSMTLISVTRTQFYVGFVPIADVPAVRRSSRNGCLATIAAFETKVRAVLRAPC